METSMILALLLSLPMHRTYKADRVRLGHVAEDVHQVVVDDGPAPGMTAGETETAMLAIAWHASGFNPHVEMCESPWKGANDNGRSLGLMQVMVGDDGKWLGHERKDVCASRAMQLHLGLEVFKQKAVCGSIERRFAAYNTGSCDLVSPASENTVYWYRTLRERARALAAAAK